MTAFTVDWEPGAEDELARIWLQAPDPPAVTAARGLFLAGAYTATGWPATMEGAVRSGEAAAIALLNSSSPTWRHNGVKRTSKTPTWLHVGRGADVAKGAAS